MIFGRFGVFGARFDWPEFFVGLAIGVVAAFVLSRFFPLFSGGGDWLRARIQVLRENLMTGARDRYRLEVLARAETLHMARAIFALNEIVIAPRLLAPPPPADPLRTDPLPEGSLDVLPNLPDWSYLSGLYRSPTLSLAEAMREGESFMIIGEPGAGKTTALAYIASRIAHGDPDFDTEPKTVPMLVHALDLGLEKGWESDPAQPLIAAVQHTAAATLGPRLPAYLLLHLRQGNTLLLLDGLDELTAQELEPVSKWLRDLHGEFPDHRTIAAGPSLGWDGLAQAGFAPVTIAPWNFSLQREFLQRWSVAWQQHVLPHLPKGRLTDVDPALINGWLVGSIRGLTPLELTLRTWAAYAGDIRGPDAIEDLTAYVSRFLDPEERRAAQEAALKWLKGRQAAAPERDLPRGTPLGDLEAAGIMVRRPDGRASFFQPAVGAFLAARAMAEGEVPEGLIGPAWAPTEAAVGYYAGMADASALVDVQMKEADDPVHSRLFRCARWLRNAEEKAPWRGSVLRELARLLQEPSHPYGLRLRTAHALVQAGDAHVATLMRRLLSAEAVSTRILAALGLGGLRDAEAVEALSGMVQNDPNLRVRQAACLGLAAIGNDAAFETLGRSLLEGEEPVRLAAAEALANQPAEGYAMLSEAMELEDVLTRRAAVFGLGRVDEAWAAEMLQKVQVEDNQWVVRGAASEVVERQKNPPWKIRPPAEDLSRVPWLVAFAASQGLGVAPGHAALEMARRAMNQGSLEEKLAAMEAVSWAGENEFLLELYQALKNTEEKSLRDGAFEALWRLSACGVELPSPSRYGVG